MYLFSIKSLFRRKPYLALLASLVLPCHAQVIFEQNFDHRNEGDYSVPMIRADWKNTSSPINHPDNASIVGGDEAYKGKALRIRYEQNLSNGSGASWRLENIGEHEELYLSYRIRFGDDMDFVLGGKLPGFAGYGIDSKRPPTGGRIVGVNDGFSARFMWRSGGNEGATFQTYESKVANLCAYVYDQKQEGQYGNNHFLTTDASIFSFKRLLVTPGKWYQIECRIKMNSPANVSNGEIEIWLDGTRVFGSSGMKWRAIEDVKIDQFLFGTFFGGSSIYWAPRNKNEYIFFDDFIISKSRIGSAPLDTDPPTPNPSSFSSAPSENSDRSSVTMVATAGSDASGPVEYRFQETTGNPGATSSGWQTDRSYTDSGLKPSTQYTYTVTMRDALGNTGNPSPSASVRLSDAPQAPVAGQVVYAVNVGGGAYTSQSGINYAADESSLKGYKTNHVISGTNDSELYRSEKYGPKFSYDINLPNGSYVVTLKFAEIYFNAVGSRVFSILGEGQPFVTNLDLFAEAGHDVAHDVEKIIQVTDGTLNLDFASTTNYAKCAAILVRTGGASSAPVGAKARYSFNNSSDLGRDDSGNGYNLTVNGTTHTDAGRSGGGASFPNDYSRLLHSSSPLGPNWTVSAWYEGLDTTGWRTLFRGERYHQILVESGSNDLGLFRHGFRDGGRDLTRENGVWHMLTAVGSADRVDYYLDGQPFGTVTGQAVDTDVRSIGNYQNGTQRFADTIDDVYLYDRKLTPSEVAELFNASSNDGGIQSGEMYLRFDESAGNTAADSTANNNSGTLLNGPTWTSGKVGGALRFDGVNDFVTVADSPELRLGKNHTVSAWVKPDVSKSNWVLIAGKGSYSRRNFAMWVQPNTQKILYQVSSAGGNTGFYSNQSIPLNDWTHVTCSYDGTKLRMYINGVLDNEHTYSQAPYNTSDPLQIGYAGFHDYFDGIIDEVRVFNRTLSGSEVGGLMGLTTVSSAQFNSISSLPAEGGYEAWAAANGVGAADKDDDNDGKSNFYEYAQGESDPQLINQDGILTFTHLKRRDDASLIYSLESTGNLNDEWISALLTELSVKAIGDFDEVTYEVPIDDEKKFIRLKITR